ncbi:MAG: DUF397 domain-containing protein [Actinomycetota bacterium]|nr:DUF397 domain-containing protein [Actinomycetota bacterium]
MDLVTGIHNGVTATAVIGARWRKSSRSGAVGNCVEIALVGEGRTAIRDSKSPAGPALVFTGHVLDSFAAALRTGAVRMPNTEAYLRTLVARGFEFLHPRDATGEIAAVVGVRAHNNVIDVVRLRAENDVVASRLPGDAVDLLAPREVLWQRTGHATAVLQDLVRLPDDRTPGSLSQRRVESTTQGCWIPTTPGRAKWLSATA